MNAFDKQWEDIQNELEQLREQLLIEDAKYENAICIAETHAADLQCKHLREEIRAKQQQLQSLKKQFEDSASDIPSAVPKKKAQSAG
jgi:fumarate hydratase class II